MAFPHFYDEPPNFGNRKLTKIEQLKESPRDQRIKFEIEQL